MRIANRVFSTILLGVVANGSFLLAYVDSPATKTIHLPPEVIPAESLLIRGYEDARTLSFQRQIAPGVTHQFDSFSTGPMTINSVFVQPSNPELVFQIEKGQDDFNKFETAWATSKRLQLEDESKQSLVVVNADFWAGQNPIGLLIDEGWIWRTPFQGSQGRTRSVFAFDDQGNFSIGIPQFQASIKPLKPADTSAKKYASEHQTTELTIDQINVTGNGPVTLYNHMVFSELPAASGSEGRAVIHLSTPGWLPNVQKTGILQLVDAETPVALNNNTVGLITKAALPDWLANGAEVELAANYANLPGAVIGATGGGPLLLVEGEILSLETASWENVGEAFVTTLHPRTAVGIKENGEVVFVTVDGRQGGRSLGIDLFDLAHYMRSLGCIHAMNLDGGGSTSMVVKGEVINFPSTNGALRPVSSTIVVQRDSTVGQNQPLERELLPRNLRVQRVDNIDFYAEVKTPDGRITREPVEYSSTHELLQAHAIELVAPETIEFPANYFSFAPGQEKVFLPQVMCSEGLPLNSRYLEFQVQTPEFMRYNAKAKTLTATSAGAGTLSITLAGGLSKTFNVTAGQETTALINSFDELLPQQTLSGVRFNEGKSKLTLNRFNKRFGEAALGFEYAMLGENSSPAETGTSKISVPVVHEFPENALGARMWVYGDGRGQWLRSEWRDSTSQRFVLNWTTGTSGIDWTGEWRELSVQFTDMQAIGSHATAPKPPFKLETFYLVQTSEAKKSNGEIIFDDLVAVLPGAGE